MPENFTLPQATTLTGVPVMTINEWVKQGLVKVVSGGGQGAGKGLERRLDAVAVMAIGLIATYRRKGATFDAIAPMAKFLAEKTEKQLQDEFKKGKTALLSGGGETKIVAPTPTGYVKNVSEQAILLIALDLKTPHE
jgi:hypothetical protein